MNDILYAFGGESLLGQSRDVLMGDMRSAGFDGLEIPLHPDFIGTRGAEGWAAIQSDLDRWALRAPVLATLWGSPCDPAQANSLEGLIHAAEDLALRVQAQTAVIRLVGCPGEPDEEALKTLSGSLIVALKHLDPVHLKIGVEFFDRGLLGDYPHAMDWLYLHNPQIGLAVDTASLAESDADPFHAIVELSKLLRLVYLTEPVSSTRFNCQRLFSALKAVGFDGPLAVRRGDDSPLSLKQEVAAIRDLWALAPVEAAAVVEE